MKKLFALLVCLLLLFALVSCGDNPCQHRDADDNSLCDYCGESYTDGKDVEGSVSGDKPSDDSHTHNYICQVISDQYFASEADCKHGDQYYYSCSCGAAGSTTFSYGEKTDHKYDQMNTSKEYLGLWGNCDSVIYYYSCKCGLKGTNTFRYDYPGGHDFSKKDMSSLYLRADATETQGKTYYYACTRCLAKSEEYYEGDAVIKLVVDGSTVERISSKYEDGYKINPPKYEDITTNPSMNKYFYGWFLDSDYQTPVTEDCVFRSDTSIYGKWIKGDSYSLNYTVSNGVATITGIRRAADIVLVVPSYIDSYPVKTIDGEAFKDETKICKAVIGGGITSIGDRAFYGCTSLSSITIPSSVTGIGSSAFYGCTSLSSITIPNSVTSIGVYAFSNSSLTSVVIPDSVTSISAYAFYKCTSLTSVTIPDSVTSIGFWAFKYCTSLTSITIPESVTSIGEQAFDDCTSLTSITIPDSVTSIGRCAFYNCSSLTSIKYRGTQSQWNSISKDYSWNGNTGNYTITYNYKGE